jgi:bacterioferritin
VPPTTPSPDHYRLAEHEQTGVKMRGHDEVIELLNEVLTAELTAVNQYFLDGKMLANWGFERLGAKFHDESIDEMKDADALIERILYLDGMPNVQRLDTIRVGETAPEKLNLALELEAAAIERLNRGIALCVAQADNGTRELLETILEGEEEHADWLEAQLELIRQVGEAHYLAQQIRD